MKYNPQRPLPSWEYMNMAGQSDVIFLFGSSLSASA